MTLISVSTRAAMSAIVGNCLARPPLLGMLSIVVVMVVLLGVVPEVQCQTTQSYSLLRRLRVANGINDASKFETPLSPLAPTAFVYFHAEERAIISPAIEVVAVATATGQKLILYDSLDRQAPAIEAPSRLQYINRMGNLTTMTQTHSLSLYNETSRTVFAPRFSELRWWVDMKPSGAPDPVGKRSVAPDLDDVFRIRDMIFLTPGRYIIGMEATMHDGVLLPPTNFTAVVTYQPSQISLVTAPAGVNGSALTPAPVIEFQDKDGVPFFTSTPVVSLFLISGPGSVAGATTIALTTRQTRVTFSDVVFSAPGEYVVQIKAQLSDNSFLTTPLFKVVLAKAPPTHIVAEGNFAGVAGFRTFTYPIVRAYDSKGVTVDARANVTMTVQISEPSIVYVGGSGIGEIVGSSSVSVRNFAYVFDEISFDLPGFYEIVVTMSTTSGTRLSTILRFLIAEAPTLVTPLNLRVNTVGTITIQGLRPESSLVQFKMSDNVQCLGEVSTTQQWIPGVPGAVTRDFTVLPFGPTDSAFLCMQIYRSPSFVPIFLHYEQKFTEPFPLNKAFRIENVGTCEPVSPAFALLYQNAGWDTVEAGRSYGCNLVPPVGGTVAPCSCSSTQSCSPLRHPTFTPPDLDIGRCECCAPWVLAVAFIVASLGIGAVIYVVWAFM